MTDIDPYRPLAEKLGYPDSPHFRRILEYLMTPRQAQLASELPNPPEVLASKLGLDIDTVNQELDELYVKGMIFPKNFETREGYRFARSMLQFHDGTQCMLEGDLEKEKELFDLWEEFCVATLDRDYALGYLEFPHPPSRVVPAYKAILDSPELLPYEDIREILKAARRLAVTACSCRKRAQVEDRQCEKSTYKNCIMIDRSADYAINRGSGRELSYEEVLEVIDQIEEDGLVHSWINAKTMRGSILCSCCYDCCVDWARLTKNGVPISRRWAKSRYEAVVDADLCNGCQVCVDRCQFDAIEMVKPTGSRKFKAVIDSEKCFGCGVCHITCAPEAISLKLVRPPEHIPDEPLVHLG